MTIALVVSGYLILAVLLMIIQSWAIRRKMVEYVVKRGSHYSFRPLYSFSPIKIGLTKENLTFKAVFGSGTDYDSSENDSINKLYGFTYGLFPHRNSLRIGWRSSVSKNEKQIQLFSYIYINGERRFNYLCTISKHDVPEIRISRVSNSEVLIEVYNRNKRGENELVGGIVAHFKKPKFPIHFKLFPYFGGQTTAPTNVSIVIEEQ